MECASKVAFAGQSCCDSERAVVSRPGNELMDTMLKIGIGDEPISDNLKRLLFAIRPLVCRARSNGQDR
jgi:hypothetical protein